MFRNRVLIVLLPVILVLTGCAGSSPDPVMPSQSELMPAGVQNFETNHLWGFWDVIWNENTGEFDSVPLRGASAAWNVVKFIDNNPNNLIINIVGTDFQPDYLEFNVDVGIQHPFPGLDIFTGFDVMGIFLSDGNSVYPGLQGFAIAGPGDPKVLNPDGFTRRWNAQEFGSAGEIIPLQGYFPGAKGTPDYTPTAVLNPYKYYADGILPLDNAFDFLEQNFLDRATFKPGNLNYRRFDIRFPTPGPPRFQYAVCANWEANIHHPDPPLSLDDFPMSAHSQEAVALSVVDSSDAYYQTSGYGGDIVLNITPWDWSAEPSVVMEEYQIMLYSDAWVGPYAVDMTVVADDPHSYTFMAEKTVEILTSDDPLGVWIEVYYPDFDYTSPIGVPNDAQGKLAAYFYYEVPIDGDPPISGDFIYGWGDSDIMGRAMANDNDQFFTNFITMPGDGPYADNDVVMLYEGHSRGHLAHGDFVSLVGALGYTFEYVPANPYVPLDTEGVKVLVISTYYSDPEPNYFTPEEIQEIKDLVHGGGQCAVVIDYPGSFPDDGHNVNKLLEDLGADFDTPMDFTIDDWAYTFYDITPDPITENVNQIQGWWSGPWDVWGEGTSLVRNSEGRTSICKSPIDF